MPPTQVRTIIEYGVWIAVTWAESSSILQPSLISESIELQSTTSQENIEIFEPDVSYNNDSTQDAKILTENDATTNDYQIVCVFCNREHKKLRSKMLPLHKADTNQFKSSVLPSIEDQEEYADLLNQLKKFSGPKISYHTNAKLILIIKYPPQENHPVKVIGIVTGNITN
ncbi:hypothetical protein TNCV_4683481 [Trichonephila clavipes]|nr:hypothetical protein TNCV_4683481 [Trichonephila clavipes]